jgi:phage baseplate assembly protein W
MPNYHGFSTYNRIRKFKITDFELAKQDLFNHFHIRKGEKLMNPKFGTIIWNIIFEPFTDAVKDAITEDVKLIAGYDPRIGVQNIVITEFTDGVKIELVLNFIPTNQIDRLVMQFDRDMQKNIT